MQPDEQVLAVCVNWNGSEVLGEALGSLLKSRGVSIKVVVVDSASTDDSLSQVPPGIEVVRLTKNLGYGAAINAVVRRYYSGQRADVEAVPKYFLLLNNDIVFDSDMVNRLVGCATSKGPGIFGPRIVRFDQPELLEAAWGEVGWSHVLACFEGIGEQKGKHWDRDQPVELLLGSVLLVHRDVFEKTGFFDEAFFMYHEEIDFLYRARLAGYYAYFCNSCEARHRGAHGTRKQPWFKTYWLRRNTVIFLRKHRASLGQWFYYLTTLKLSLFYNILALNWSRASVILKGVRDGFLFQIGEPTPPEADSDTTETI
jgi:GT2 family glycosyltransferase